MTHLAAHHLAMLHASAIGDQVIADRGYFTATTKAGVRDLGFAPSQLKIPALVLPVHNVHGEIATYQVRPDHPRTRGGKAIKYDTPAGSTMVMDVPPCIRPLLGDPSKPLFVTEGIKKGDALASCGFCAVAILGVWNWRGTNDRGGKVALADWEVVALNARQIYLVFDSDIMLKPNVHQALARLKGFLESRKAQVAVIYLPAGDGGTKQGVDDYLASGQTVDALLALASPALRSLAAAGDDDTPEAALPYEATPEGLVWHKPTRDGSVPTPLTNFTAEIVTDTEVDDGAETWRTFTIRATLRGHEYCFDVPAARFTEMQWPVKHLGAEALLYPGLALRDHVRCAVQMLSTAMRKERVYAHLGWRELGERWRYLHAGGCIGEEVTPGACRVEVDRALRDYSLPDPPTGSDLQEAVRASMRLLELAPSTITLPLYAAIWRAVLAEGDCSVHVTGKTGEGKTALAALAQQHFGAAMVARQLPANWESTGNALEALAFAAKDALLVVDEFTPTDSAQARRQQRAAEQLLRGTANRRGRQRMRADTTLRPEKMPRGFILSTGEEVPKGQSLRARMIIVEVVTGAVDFTRLTSCQRDAAAGVYAGVMAAFVHWLAPQYAEVLRQWRGELDALRAWAWQGQHKRTPENVASLALGWRAFLWFAVDVGAMALDEAEQHWHEGWSTLGQVAAAQAEHHAMADDAERFVALLRDALASGRAHLRSTLAYADHSLAGDKIGWEEDGKVYLLPEVSYAVAQELGKQTGEPLMVSSQVLRKRLQDRGDIAELEPSRQGRLLVRKTFEGERHDVLALYRVSLTENERTKRTNGPMEPENPTHWYVFGPPLVRDWSGFSKLMDHSNSFNNSSISTIGTFGTSPQRRETLERMHGEKNWYVSENKTVPIVYQTDPKNVPMDPSAPRTGEKAALGGEDAPDENGEKTRWLEPIWYLYRTVITPISRHALSEALVACCFGVADWSELPRLARQDLERGLALLGRLCDRMAEGGPPAPGQEAVWCAAETRRREARQPRPEPGPPGADPGEGGGTAGAPG